MYFYIKFTATTMRILRAPFDTILFFDITLFTLVDISCQHCGGTYSYTDCSL